MWKRRELKITAEPFYLTKEENDARVKRLARAIWDCIQHSSEKRKMTVEELLREDDDLLEKLSSEIPKGQKSRETEEIGFPRSSQNVAKK